MEIPHADIRIAAGDGFVNVWVLPSVAPVVRIGLSVRGEFAFTVYEKTYRVAEGVVSSVQRDSAQFVVTLPGTLNDHLV